MHKHFLTRRLSMALSTLDMEIEKSRYGKVGKFEICYVAAHFDPDTGMTNCEAGVSRRKADMVSVYFAGTEEDELPLIGFDLPLLAGERILPLIVTILSNLYGVPVFDTTDDGQSASDD